MAFYFIFSVPAICLVLGVDLIKQIHFKEPIFLSAFIVVYLFFFFLIKHYYFDSGRNLILLKRYLNYYPPKRRLYLKIIVLAICCIIPFLLVFVIWFEAAWFNKTVG